jgi:hypothetical protein
MRLATTLKGLDYYTCACEQALPGTQRPRIVREGLQAPLWPSVVVVVAVIQSS